MVKIRKITILLALLASLSLIIGTLLFFWTTELATPILDPNNAWSYLVFFPLLVFLVHLSVAYETTPVTKAKHELREFERQHPDLHRRRIWTETGTYVGMAATLILGLAFGIKSWQVAIILSLLYSLHAKLLGDLARRYPTVQQSINVLEEEAKKEEQHFWWTNNATLIMAIIFLVVVLGTLFLLPLF